MNMLITDEEFIEVSANFDDIEKRGSYYWMAIDLFNNGFEMEAHILLLATWNFAAFRYALKDFDIYGFRDKLKELDSYFNRMEGESFKTIDFDRYSGDIKEIFATLSRIKGIQYTGASKVMHLRNRNVFVPWDGYIAGQKPKKYYRNLEVVKNGFWKPVEYRRDAEGYFKFLKDMQSRFNYINFKHPKKTFAKAIDEFNYVKITLPIQQIEKEKSI